MLQWKRKKEGKDNSFYTMVGSRIVHVNLKVGTECSDNLF